MQDVYKRQADDYNEKIATGTIELLVQKLEVLNKSKNVLPFEVIKMCIRDRSWIV